MEGLSGLRLLAGLFGCAALMIVGSRLRQSRDHRGELWPYLLVGLSLVSVGIFPGLVKVPQDFLSVGEIPGGRLLTLLIVSSLSLWGFVLSARSRLHLLDRQLDRQISAQAARELTGSLPAGQGNEPRVLVVIPALNEAGSIEQVLEETPDHVAGWPVQVVVVDDGSEDETAAVARRAGAWVAHHFMPRGGGAALRTGFTVARQVGAEVVVTMDADGQHDGRQLPQLTAPILEGRAKIVIGSRVLGEHDRVSWARSAGVRIFSRIINLLMGTRITDCASGYRALDLSSLRSLRLAQDQYHTAELIIEAAKKGLTIVEVPIRSPRRLAGSSKKGRDWVYGLRFLRTLLLTWLR